MASGAAGGFRLTSISSAAQQKHLFPRGPALKCMESGTDPGTSQSLGLGSLEILLVRLGDRPTPGTTG